MQPVPGPRSGPLPRPVPDFDVDHDSPGGGARPAAVSAGPTSLPLKQTDFDPAYAPGTGQLTDPLSCM